MASGKSPVAVWTMGYGKKHGHIIYKLTGAKRRVAGWVAGGCWDDLLGILHGFPKIPCV